MSLLFTSYSFTPYSTVMAVVTVINLLIVALAWRRRVTAGARYLMWLFLGMAVSSFAYVFIYATMSTSVMALWFQIANVGFAVAGPLLLLFGLEYVQMGQHITWRLTAPLTIFVLATLVLTFTNGIHHQIFAAFSVNPQTGLGVLEGRGAWGWLQLAVIYACASAVMVMLARAVLRFPPFFKVQVMIVLAATVLPTVGGVVSLLFQPIPGVGWTVLAFGLSGILLVVAIQRQYMFNLIPLARAQLIDSMTDGVVVLDTVDRIVDVNAPARHLLKSIGGELIGQPARKVLPVWPELERGQGGVITIPDTTATPKSPVAARHLEVHVTPLQDQFKRIIGRMFILHDVTMAQQQMAEIQALQDRLRDEAIHDELTGLYNRNYLGEALATGLAQARRDSLPLSIIMLDVDHLKAINDEHGIDAGDTVLRQLAELLRRSTRDGDVICRLGGDEFTLLLSNTSLDDAFSCAERWRRTVSKTGVDYQGAHIGYTISLGVAGYPNYKGNLDELLAIADQALYSAKNAGRDRAVMWQQTQTAHNGPS